MKQSFQKLLDHFTIKDEYWSYSNKEYKNFYINSKYHEYQNLDQAFYEKHKNKLNKLKINKEY